eukprot:TRINITY_DN99733_c0_g1_i1.p1 TRINITY_DN99733_c0_g1~~TRINITY_DN99733_c0_g1_i1.p1  ORF type:complete len:239 (+),score=57.32 TRINITY_DN99733_c0_g1_i1:40-717(+)
MLRSSCTLLRSVQTAQAARLLSELGRRQCSNGAGSGGGSSPQVLQRNFSGTLDLLTINVRHIFNSINLQILNVVYPNAWNSSDFRAGAAEAFSLVNRLLDEGDFQSLRGLLSDELLEELRSSHPASAEGVDYELKEVRQLGIYKSIAKADAQGDEAVFVTPLLRVTEKYTLSKDSTIWWEVRRLHKWTFARVLPGEDGQEASEWQIVAMDKKRWRPPGLDEKDAE